MHSSDSKEHNVVSKQFIKIAGRLLLQYAVDPFLEDNDCQSIVICVPAAQIVRTQQLFNDSRVHVTSGGASRTQSVLNGLELLCESFKSDQWVMIHDAARANLHLSDIQKLKQTISSEIDGGILAKPAQDTLKHIASTHNLTTLDRSRIWHAMTPQMFRLGPLINALRGANQAKIEITDESSAMEIAGASVILVHGRTDNIKLTYPEDLPILEKLIEERNAQK